MVILRTRDPRSESNRLDSTFAALADPTRRAILARLAKGDATVNDLVKPFNISQPAISKHLKVLERAGLITKDIDKQRRPRRIEAAPMAEATEWLEKYKEFWEVNYKRLDDLLSVMKSEDKTKRRKVNGKQRFKS